MGTPIPSKVREHEYSEKVTEPVVVKRQLTEEERRYYDSLRKPGKRIVAYNYQDATLFSEDKESEEMKREKIEKPSKEKLIEMCKQYPGKYRATLEIAKVLGVSNTTVDNWIKAYGITGIWDNRQDTVVKDKPEQTTRPTPEENMQAAEKENCSGTTEEDTREFDGVTGQRDNKESNIENKDQGIAGIEYLEDPNDPNELTLAAQPGDRQTVSPEAGTPTERESETSKPERRHLVTQVLCMGRVIGISRANKEFSIKNFQSTEHMTIKFDEFRDFLKELYEIAKLYV